MLRAVLDTSVLVAGLRSRKGASHVLLREVAIGHLIPLVTTALFLEYESVLKRAEQRLEHGLSLTEIDGFLAAFASASIGIDVSFQWRPQLSDPNDEMVLEAAINGRADSLVTHNIRDFAKAAGHFKLRLLTPGQLLKELRS
jgi:putative PIN family toxin of toxin-antitoxin system